jgi:formate/nitrite transporter FocA (FNT family)
MLTRLRTGTRDDVAKVIASVAIGFLIAGLGMFHSILIFAGIQVGGYYTYRDWLLWFSWIMAGNIVGGIALTTLL